jgi:tetratricopeptide (TPR) repeat protein
MRASSAWAALASALLVCVAAREPRAEESATAAETAPAPSLSLSAWGKQTLTQDRSEPLLLTIELGSPLAAARREENRTRSRHLRALEKSGVLAKMSEADREAAKASAQPLPLPVFALGSDDDPIWEVLSVRVRTAGGKEVESRVRALRSTTRGEPAIRLDGAHSAAFYFGLDPDALSRLPAGEYRLHAQLDTRGKRGMWQGTAVSPVVKLTLTQGGSGAAQASDVRAGRYYWLDGDLDRVEEIAARMLARDPESVDAWVLRADLAAAKGELEEAERAYQLLIGLYARQHAGDRDPRPPEFFTQRLREVQAARTAQKAR